MRSASCWCGGLTLHQYNGTLVSGSILGSLSPSLPSGSGRTKWFKSFPLACATLWRCLFASLVDCFVTDWAVCTICSYNPGARVKVYKSSIGCIWAREWRSDALTLVVVDLLGLPWW